MLLSLLLPIFSLAMSYPEEMRISVPVPQSELKLENTRVNEDPIRGALELGYSSFGPEDFRRSTYRRQNTRFDTALPYLSLNYRSPFLSLSRGSELAWRVGASFTTLERTAPALAPNRQATQQLSVYQARAGVEYGAPVLFGVVQPYIGLAALPTLALAPDSELEGSVSAFGLGAEANGGILIRTGWEMVGFTDATLGLGAHRVFGSVEDSELTGWGAQGFLRVGI